MKQSLNQTIYDGVFFPKIVQFTILVLSNFFLEIYVQIQEYLHKIGLIYKYILCWVLTTHFTVHFTADFCLIWSTNIIFRSTEAVVQMFFKTGVLKKFANFTGKHLGWSLFLTKLQVEGLPSSFWSCIVQVFYYIGVTSSLKMFYTRLK